MPNGGAGGPRLEVPVRVSRRARRARIVVDGQRRVEVVVPPRTPPGVVERLLAEHAVWLERQLAKPPLPFRLGLQREDCVWIGGEARPRPEVPDLGRWYREKARAAALRLADSEAGRLGVSYGTLTVRDQRTRWGSCSSRGALSINWRLILAPEQVLAYVVAHELCHLVRHDHSPRFWRTLGALRPTYQEERRWLSEHGHELLAYRVPAG